MSYTLGFLAQSKSNDKTLEIFKEFGAKAEQKLFNNKEPRTYFTIIQDYNEIVKDLDESFIWAKALTQEKESRQKTNADITAAKD